METIVSKKPIEVWMVSAVPTACVGTDSVTSALNCAESPTTKKPQTIGIATRSAMERTNTSGESSAHVPLTIIATVTSHSRPLRSAAMPPQTHPMPPTAMATKATTETRLICGTEGDIAAKLAAVNAGIQVQNE